MFDRVGPRAATIAIGGLIALKIALLLVLAWNRMFVMDEFQQLGWAKYIPNRIGWLAVHHPKALGFAIFFEPAHLIGWDARSMLLIGRMGTALLACGTLGLVYALARSIGETKTRSALIVLVLLSFSNFIERIFETRGDPLSVFFAAAALLVAVRARDRDGRIVAAGALSGVAFLCTQKAIYFDVALGLALVGDAALGRRYALAIKRGAWLVAGWVIPIVVYCLGFGGSHPLPVLSHLFFGPTAVMSPQIVAEYGGLRQYVVQTLERNAVLYLFCFAGMVLAMLRIRILDERRRIALIFSIVVTALVFAHNQPWPYVFIMALPFIALWAFEPFDALAHRRLYSTLAWAVLGIAIAASFAKNIIYLRIDNHDQLALVARAEKLVGPDEVYFDGVGMLPNRMEPSTLWLDRHAILQTLGEGKASEAYRIFAKSPPKIILWSYRMDAVEPLLDPLIRNSYVQVAPNIRMAGARLLAGETVTFKVPVSGRYALYDSNGKVLRGLIKVNGMPDRVPAALHAGSTVAISSGQDALLVPQGSYRGEFESGSDDKNLFAGVYD